MPSEKTLLVLLVEDDPDTALLFKHLFAKICPTWDVKHAENGLLAIDWIIPHGLPDVVVTDLDMPCMNGFELIAWIRAEQTERAAPIYVMSGSLDAETVERCRYLGANAFIPKQCCPDELRTMLGRLFPSEQPVTPAEAEAEQMNFPSSIAMA